MWPNRKLLDHLDIDIPVIQAPMAGANDAGMVVAVSEAGGLGSLPCGMLDTTQAQNQIGAIQQRTEKPFGVNFLCHSTPDPDADRDAAWREVLAQYYAEFGLEFSFASSQRASATVVAELITTLPQAFTRSNRGGEGRPCCSS